MIKINNQCDKNEKLIPSIPFSTIDEDGLVRIYYEEDGKIRAIILSENDCTRCASVYDSLQDALDDLQVLNERLVDIEIIVKSIK